MRHHRKPNRLADYNYSLPGFYFITICTKNMENCLGTIHSGKCIPSAIGLVVNWHWQRIPQHYPHVHLDDFQLMPDHLHGIIIVNECFQSDAGIARQRMLIPRVVGSFKKFVTLQIRREITQNFKWQRSYYDHVIRNEKSLEKIREYILSNPENWEQDRHWIDDTPFLK